MRSVINFVEGQSEGTSFFTWLLIEFCQKTELSYVLVDMDRRGDVALRYPRQLETGIEFSVDLDDFLSTDRLFDFPEQQVIVHVPSGSQEFMDKFIDLAERSDEVLIRRWYVSSGSTSSFNRFSEILTINEDKFVSIFVHNMKYGCGLAPETSVYLLTSKIDLVPISWLQLPDRDLKLLLTEKTKSLTELTLLMTSQGKQRMKIFMDRTDAYLNNIFAEDFLEAGEN